MLTSAFPSDIDAAINTALSSYTVLDWNNVAQPVPVTYKVPEAELFAETHPSIMFYQIQLEPDLTRYSNDVIRLNQVYDGNGNLTQVDVKNDSEPFVIHYDIRVYTLFEQDNKQLVKNIMTTFPSRGTLLVNGNRLDMFLERYADISKNHENLSISDLQILERQPQREQVSSLRYKVHFAMDINAAITYKVATTVVPTTHT